MALAHVSPHCGQEQKQAGSHRACFQLHLIPQVIQPRASQGLVSKQQQ